jgi:hypothetical protein
MINRDRAAVITTAIMQIAASTWLSDVERHQGIEALVRDEIADIHLEICADQRTGHDD